MAKISVIIPLFNQAAYLPDCLRSLQRQTHRDWEAIVVNDGSTDEGPAVAARFAEADERIKVASKPNGGLSSARNFGLNLARGRFVQFLDSDDVILPPKFELQLSALASHPRHSLCVSGYRYGAHDNLDSVPMPGLPLGLGCDTSLVEFIDRWEFEASVPCHCFLFSADLFLRGGLRFDTKLRNHEDFECWVRLLSDRPKVFLVDQCLAVYRLNPGSMCRNLGRLRDGFLEAVDLLEKNSDLPSSVHRALARKKRQILREYGHRMGLHSSSPFQIRIPPKVRIELGAVRRKILG